MSPVPEARINKNLTLAVLVFFFALADRALGVVGHSYSCLVEKFSRREFCKKPGKLQNGGNKQLTTKTEPKKIKKTPTRTNTAEASRYVYG